MQSRGENSQFEVDLPLAVHVCSWQFCARVPFLARVGLCLDTSFWRMLAVLGHVGLLAFWRSFWRFGVGGRVGAFWHSGPRSSVLALALGRSWQLFGIRFGVSVLAFWRLCSCDQVFWRSGGILAFWRSFCVFGVLAAFWHRMARVGVCHFGDPRGLCWLVRCRWPVLAPVGPCWLVLAMLAHVGLCWPLVLAVFVHVGLCWPMSMRPFWHMLARANSTASDRKVATIKYVMPYIYIYIYTYNISRERERERERER